MNTKYNAAALAFALLATSSAAMNADTTSSTPVLTAKAAAADDNVKAVTPVKNEFYRLFRVRKNFIAFKDGIVWKLADDVKLANINLINQKARIYKVGETVALNSKGYDKYGFNLRPYLDCLMALKAAK